ncbi:prolyl 3-hydroxylase 2-like isoform X1 [Pomacea canaliculata]|uniref:prolyl 3-hydroxylase 2-like isoform X1 n=1 Tax=Pomacea canaliculata TaxID=400727 RepID=UPI000D72ED8F|nr:prolyl 3-hydroxylase 2-like isoform X1 [Pomacea canaliculata]
MGTAHGHVRTGKRTFRVFLQVDSAMLLVVTTIILVMPSPLHAKVNVDDLSSKSLPYFDQLYPDGVKAYKEQLWYKCAYNLEKAISDYNNFQNILTDCRIDCKNGARKSNLENFTADAELGEFSIFEAFLKNADCFRRCKSELLFSRPGFRISRDFENIFAKRKPYQYLQYCWYKLDRVKQAASAAYTYFLANPKEEDAYKNVVFYREKAKVPDSDFVDLELKPYKEQYILGMLAHNEEDWTNVVEHLEKSLDFFFEVEKRCRANCEGTGEEDLGRKDFVETVADRLLKILDCQLGCEGNLSIIYSEPIEGFLADQFHYLQYSYFKIGKFSEAVEATASYLLLHPNDTVMEKNKKIFINKFQYSEEQFIPRKEIRQYMEQKKKLIKLLEYLKTNYKNVPEDAIYLPSDDSSSDSPAGDATTQEVSEFKAWMERFERLGLHLIADGGDLKRSYRFAADGLLKPDQCEDLLDLVEYVHLDKKGVQTFTLEHARETVLTADEDYEASLRLFMRATEVARHYTQHYYNLSSSLYFKNATIVCWTSIPEPEVEADCVPQEFGSCLPEPVVLGSQVKADQFVSVTYLNTQEESEFYFLSENASFDASLGVKCGRTIGFQYGDRHGVRVPRSGRRCAMVVTYMSQKNPDEMEYIKTLQILHRLDEKRMEAGLSNAKEVLEKLAKTGVKVVKNGSDLLGKERVLADGLATNAECTSLKNMVMSGALIGDGYDHLAKKPSAISPHTPHEMFQGLTIYRAAKLMHMGLVNTFSMKAFLDLSEKSRLFIEKYFNLTKPLYFDFTHLVCRSAIDNTHPRDDLSHPVHADNCVLQPDGTCMKVYPAFIQRDYSGILYLNDDFEGGDFFFAYGNKTEQVSVQPKCGRLVGFNAAEFHGVKAVRKGVRCALAMWFTLNPNFKELAHIHAKKVFRIIQEEREAEEKKLSTDGNSLPQADDASKIAVNDHNDNEDVKIAMAAKEVGNDGGNLGKSGSDEKEGRPNLVSETEALEIKDVASETEIPDVKDVVSETETPESKDVVSETEALEIKDVASETETPEIKDKVSEAEKEDVSEVKNVVSEIEEPDIKNTLSETVSEAEISNVKNVVSETEAPATSNVLETETRGAKDVSETETPGAWEDASETVASDTIDVSFETETIETKDVVSDDERSEYQGYADLDIKHKDTENIANSKILYVNGLQNGYQNDWDKGEERHEL